VHIGDAALAARGIVAHARRIAQEGVEVDAPAVQRAIPGQWAGERERTVHLPTAAERMRLELAEPQVVVGIAETTPEVRYLSAANTRGAGAYAPVGERDVPLLQPQRGRDLSGSLDGYHVPRQGVRRQSCRGSGGHAVGSGAGELSREVESAARRRTVVAERQCATQRIGVDPSGVEVAIPALRVARRPSAAVGPVPAKTGAPDRRH